jgi:hypothetical protein
MPASACMVPVVLCVYRISASSFENSLLDQTQRIQKLVDNPVCVYKARCCSFGSVTELKQPDRV